MPSTALADFENALLEVDELRTAYRAPQGAVPPEPALVRVLGRASVVLLSSHFERYVYSVNEEATDAVNAAPVEGRSLPEALRLLHSHRAVEAMVETGWQRRRPHMEAFVASDAWLWDSTGGTGQLEHERLLEWMKTPRPRKLVRFFAYWGIPDIFDAMTREAHTRTELWLKIDELVTKRNNIAHGDATVEATRTDLSRYRSAALTFCRRADKHLSRAIHRITTLGRPW